jgi:hypothetical protein
MPALEPHGEDVTEEKFTEESLEEAKAAVEICREELEQQIMEHLMKESNDR